MPCWICVQWSASFVLNNNNVNVPLLFCVIKTYRKGLDKPTLRNIHSHIKVWQFVPVSPADSMRKTHCAYMNRLDFTEACLSLRRCQHIFHIIHKTSESRWITFIFSLILSIPVFYLSPLLSVCIVDVLSSDFLYGTALLVLTYTLITQTARNPFLSPLPHQLFSSLFVCVCVCMHTSVFVWLNIPVYTLELDRDGRRVLLCK